MVSVLSLHLLKTEIASSLLKVPQSCLCLSHTLCYLPLSPYREYSKSVYTSNTKGVLSFQCVEFPLYFSQGYQGRGGKETCWFLGCCIHGVLSQGEWGKDRCLFWMPTHGCSWIISFLTQIHTLMTIFMKCRLRWRFSSGSFWRWRKQMETHPQKRRSVLWCKSVSRTSVSSFAGDRRHNFTSLPIATSPTPRHCNGALLAPLWYQIDLHSKATAQAVDKLFH